MYLTFSPSALRGAVTAPPSKSLSHRLLLAAGLSRGESVVENVALSEDVQATLDCLRALGADVQPGVSSVAVRGFDPCEAPAAVLPCLESASTLRFFLPLCLLSGRPFTLTGAPGLLARPLSVYEALCRERGIRFERAEASVTVCGRLTPGAYAIPGGVSSQFASGLLFALPLLPGDSTMTVQPPLVSRPYLDLTLSVLEKSGIFVKKIAGNRFLIPGNQQYSPQKTAVEGDWSNTAPFFALRALGHAMTVDGLNPDSLQGDCVIVPLLDRLREGFAEIDLRDCPDLGPVLFAAAAALHGARFTGTRRLRGKESDRVAAMQAELAKLGVRAEAEEDALTVRPGSLAAPACPLESHGDHRVAMALSVLLLQTGGVLTGAEAVAKSWPDYFSVLRSVGGVLA